MKRCYLVVGPESAGNRLLGAILTRAGCQGEAATNARWNKSLPTVETPAMVIRSYPHGEEWPDLSAILPELWYRGYEVTTLITVRHPAAIAASQVESGHARDFAGAEAQIRDAYRRIMREVSGTFHLVPYEIFAYGPPAATRALLNHIGMPVVTAGPLIIDGQERDQEDANAKYFLD